jgi:NADPH:quinone reductase
VPDSTNPSTMAAIECVGHGAPEVMRLATVPRPEPGADEVLIRVLAAGVNRPDVLQREGRYPPPPGASPILGLEVAGIVTALGSDVRSWRVGDHVTGLANGGGYAEYCAVPQGQCLPWPSGYQAAAAAALPETFFTVWANLFQRGGLRAGERVLVHGGTSGIGVTAVQLASAFGAEVYATVGSDAKAAACRSLGAREAINYRTADFAAEIERLTGGRGVDVILDMVGATYFARNIRCLAKDGRLIQIAFLEGAIVERFDLTPVMTKRLTVTGSTMRPRTSAEKALIAAELRAQVWPLLDRGLCAPPIHATFPLERAADAHALMESSQHIGKIVLTVGE